MRVSLRASMAMVMVPLVFITSGCASDTVGSRSSVSYGDTGAVETTTIDFGSTDLQMTAQQMINSLLSDEYVAAMLAKYAPGRPRLFFDRIKNKTTEHIDTESITDTIRAALVQSRKFIIVKRENIGALAKELEFQKSDLADKESAKTARFSGADYVLDGNMSSIVKSSGRTKVVYYKITMTVANVATSEEVWAAEKEISKTAKRPLVGD